MERGGFDDVVLLVEEVVLLLDDVVVDERVVCALLRHLLVSYSRVAVTTQVSTLHCDVMPAVKQHCIFNEYTQFIAVI